MENNPLDEGFLICTQLVKTSGADRGGLQVGDIISRFGHYTSVGFPGLRSLMHLIRNNAGKSFDVEVWRKMVQEPEPTQDEGEERKVMYQKLLLQLTPSESDNGGVLGAVLNTYPIPVSRKEREQQR
jgi:C-terminal processing protease CtpA/Prc